MNCWLTKRLTLLFLGLIITRLCLSSARSQQEGAASSPLPLIPIFSTAQDSPEFEGTFRMDTVTEKIDTVKTAIDLLQNGADAVLVDGKTYPQRTIDFVNWAYAISVGRFQSVQTFRFHIALSHYLPKDRGKNRRSKKSLQAGTHTLSVKFGGKTYGPVTFEWKDDPWHDH